MTQGQGVGQRLSPAAVGPLLLDLLLSLSYRRGDTPWGPRVGNFLRDYCHVWGLGPALHRLLSSRLATSGNLARTWPSVHEDLGLILSMVDPEGEPVPAPPPAGPAGSGAGGGGVGKPPAPLPPIRVPSMLRATSTGSASSATRTPIEQARQGWDGVIGCGVYMWGVHVSVCVVGGGGGGSEGRHVD